jgi:hypothetical protein
MTCSHAPHDRRTRACQCEILEVQPRTYFSCADRSSFTPGFLAWTDSRLAAELPQTQEAARTNDPPVPPYGDAV